MDNLEITRVGYGAWNNGDFGWFERNLTDDIEVHPQPDLFPDLEESYHGIDGFRSFWNVFRDAWSSIDIEVQHLEPLTDDDLVSVVRFDGVGRGSGVEVSLTFLQWLTLRDGKLARLDVELPDERELELADM